MKIENLARLLRNLRRVVLRKTRRIIRWLTATRRRKILATVLAILILFTTFRLFFFQKPAAAWFDDDYGYRQEFSFTHNADLSDRAVTFSLDTAELITAGVMQSDCDDTRFTDINGLVLTYELTGTCNNAATTYEVVFPSVINGTNPAYVYYGNPSAVSASVDTSGYTALTPSGGDPSITDRTSEEKGPSPAAYWKFDEGYGPTAFDTTSNANHATGDTGSDAPVVVAVTRAAAPTVTGNQDITTTDLNGLTPKAAIAIASYAEVNGTAFDDAGLSWGITDGTRELVMHSNAEHDQTTVDVASEIQNTHVVLIDQEGESIDKLSATFVSFIANGIRVNWDVVNAAWDEKLVTWVFFAGADLTAHANSIDLGDTVDNAVDVTQPGFEPDLVFTGALEEKGPGEAAAGWRGNLGVVHNDGAGVVTQRSFAYNTEFGVTTTNPGVVFESNHGLGPVRYNTTLLWRGSFGSFDANGFTVTTVDAGAKNTDLLYLALDLGGAVSASVGTHTTPTAGGNDSETGPGFKPQFVMLGMTQAEASNTLYTTGDIAASTGIAVFDADEAYATSHSDEDGVGQTNNQSLSENLPVQLPDDDGTAGLTASFVSFDTNGWTNNYSAFKGTGKLFWYLAIEKSAANWQTEDMCVTDKCLKFDGSDDVVTVTNADSIDLDRHLAGAFTFQAWVRVNSDGEGNVGQIFNKGSATYLRITNEGTDGLADLEASVDLDGTGDATLTVTNGITLNQWHHVAMTYTDDGDDEIIVYIDAIDQGSSTGGDGVPIADANKLLIGGPTTANFHGFIDEFKIYKEERTEAQIKTDFIKGTSSLHGTQAAFGIRTYYDLSEGLVGYWKMDDAGVDAEDETSTDSSGNGNGGNLEGDDGVGDNGTGMDCTVAGNFGTGCEYDGTDDYVNVSDIDFTDQITVAFWANPDTVAGWQGFVGKDDGGTLRDFNFRTQGSGGDMGFTIWNDSASAVTASGTNSISADKWQHVTGTYDGVSVKLYVDGNLIDSQSQSGNIDNSSFAIHLGQAAATNGYFDGTLDDVRIYNRAFSPAEVDFLYNWGPGPVGYWPMDENTGTSTVYDRSGNANDGTMNNMTEDDWVPGQYGSALDFDNTDDNVSMADDSVFDFGTGDFSLSGWFNHSSTLPSAPTGASTTTTTVTTTTDDSEGFGEASWQHSVVHDPNNDRWHIIYVDSGADVHTQSTADTSGTSWTDGIDIKLGTSEYNLGDFSCVVETDDGATYMHCTYNKGDEIIYYKRCTLSGTTPFITCDTEQTVVDSSHPDVTTVDDFAIPSIAVDSNDCVLIFAELEDDSVVPSADQYQMFLFKEGATCGDGTWSDETGFPKVSIQSETGYQSHPMSGIESFGDLDAQLFWLDADDPDDADLETIFFDGDTDTLGTQRALDTDIEFGGNIGNHWSVVFGTTSLTFGMDDTTTDVDAYYITTKDGSTVNQVDTNLNTSVTSNVALQTTTAIVDTVASDGNDIWAFAMDVTDTADIYYSTSTDSGASWSSSTLWVDSFDTTEAKFLSAAFNSENCDIMVTWLGNIASPWNINTKVINTGSCGQDMLLARHNEAGYKTYMDKSGYICFGVDDDTIWGDDDSVCTSTSYADSNWHHFEAVKNATSDITLYIDGIQIGQDTSLLATGAIDASSVLYLGINTDGSGSPWDGIIDEVKIYNYARTQAQIIEDMNAGHPAPGSPIGSPVGYWKFDEGYGDTANDTSVNGNDGDLAGGTTCPQSGDSACPSWTHSGKFDKALDFDIAGTTDDYIQTTSNELKTANEFTMTTWIKADSTDAHGMILWEGDAIANGYGSGAKTEQEAHFSVGDYTGDSVDDKITFFLGDTDETNDAGVLHISVDFTDTANWHHLAGVVKNLSTSPESEFYIDGVLVGSDTGTTTRTSRLDWDTNLRIGRPGADWRYFDGKIDEVKIYNFALTADQIKVDFNKGSAASFGEVDDQDYEGFGGNPPVGWWNFNENTGTTANDISENNNTGTLTSMTEEDWIPVTGAPAYANGLAGSALDFDGSNDYVSVADHVDLRFDSSTQDFSLFAWAKKDVQSTNMAIMYKQDTADDGWHILFISDNTVQCSIDTIDVESTSTITDNNWHFVGCTIDRDGNGQIYIDGVPDGSPVAISSEAMATTEILAIGRVSFSSLYPFDGLIDDVRIYDYVRTDAQIAYDFNRGKPVGYWKFDECQGTTAYDSGSGGNNGTIIAGDTSGSNDSVGTCSSGAGDEMWDNGTTGKRNASLDFDGTNDKVDTTDFDILNTITIEAWIDWDAVGESKGIISKRTPTENAGNWLLRLDDTGTSTLEFVVWNPSQDTANSVSTISTNTWTHVVVTFDDSINTVKFYINGVLDNTDTAFSSNLADNPEIIVIGSPQQGTTTLFDGQIDDVKIFNYIRTADQIKRDFNNGAQFFGPSEGSP